MDFRKLHGAGNDFILLTGPAGVLGKDWSHDARDLCARRTGIGADGLVVSALIGSAPPVLGVTCYNADGSIATMCGNALRCAAWCAASDHHFRDMTLVMAGVEHQGLVHGQSVEVTAEVGAVEMRRVQAVWNHRPFWFDSAHTGTEHVVAVVDDVDGLDAEAFGRIVRHHDRLAPLGTNVNFVQSVGRQELKIRTYERGVEAETLSCGSGAVAAVVIAAHRGLVGAAPVTVHNKAGTPLTVRPHTDRPRAFWVGGPVTHSFEGVIA
ncbi:diaminopimelate epimerase [Streptomyces sannanensis]|uniref:Diaminopimelate epimerase n=1 Tax=Streptomyces sannanensis TaxID=285536 RepID=A0ABP6S918_9ACTN